MSRKKSKQPTNQPLTTHATAGYRPPSPAWSCLLDRTRMPVFDYNWAEAMELTSQVRFGVAVGNGPLYQSEIEVTCNNEEVATFVQEQWKKLWTTGARRILSHKRAGYGGLEVVYDYDDSTGRLCLKNVHDFHPLDTKVLVDKGEPCGIQVTGRNLQEPIKLTGPRAVWLKYNAEYGNLYGRSLYRGAFEPWWEKYGPQGATDLRRLKYRKDSWIGDIIYYPKRLERIQLANGTVEEVSGHDLAVQMVSQRAAGGILALPSDRDDNGNREYEYTPPTSIAGGSDILAYVDSLDWEIWKGLLIPREVVEAAASGSGFSGRSVPMIAFLSMRDSELQDIVASFRHVFEFMVEFNFGNVEFHIQPKPLAEQFAEQVGGTQAGGAIGGTNSNAAYDIFGKRENDFQFSIADEPSIADRAMSAAMELGSEVRRQILAALKKNSIKKNCC